MNILAADDEPLALDMLTDTIKEVMPDARIFSFMKPSQLLSFAEDHSCEVAFLDINMRGISGLELAQRLKQGNPRVNIIFVTGYNEYAGDAMSMHASGYITKPVTVEKIRREICDLRHPVLKPEKKLLKINCFGNFEVYTPEGEILHFERSKGKEVFAYLIYRSGASCTTKEIAATLFEDSEYDKNQRGYIQKIIASMMQTLKRFNAEDVISKNYNSLAVNINLVDCDFYRFARKDKDAVNSYLGEFMRQYSWAESAIGYLEELFWKNQ